MKLDFVYSSNFDIIENERVQREKMTKNELDCIPDANKACPIVCPFAVLPKMK